MAFFSVDASGSVMSLQASSDEFRGVDEKIVRNYFGSKLPEEEVKELSDSELAELASQALNARAAARA